MTQKHSGDMHAWSKTQVKQQVAELQTADGILTSTTVHAVEKAEAVKPPIRNSLHQGRLITTIPVLPERLGEIKLEELYSASTK